MAAARGERRAPFVWFAAAGVVVVIVTLSSFGLWVLRFGEPPLSTFPTTAATAGLSALARDIELRAAPSPAAREVARAFRGTPVRLTGRLEDGSWYAVEVVGRLDALGWVPVDALTSTPDVAVVAPPLSGNVVASGRAREGDLPNLVFERLAVRRNRLFAVLANDSYADLAGSLTVTIGGGAPQRIELPGKTIRPGDRVEVELEGEYVQRRASVVASVTSSVQEETLEDNRLELTLEPDMPNDLEVLAATPAPELAVTVRNNSPIPLVGSINVTVRETQPTTRLLARLVDARLRIDAGGTQVFRFPALVGLDLARTLVLIDTTAINDTALENDAFPR